MHTQYSKIVVINIFATNTAWIFRFLLIPFIRNHQLFILGKYSMLEMDEVYQTERRPLNTVENMKVNTNASCRARRQEKKINIHTNNINNLMVEITVSI